MRQSDSEANADRVAAQLGLSESERVVFDELERLMTLNSPADRATADLPVLWGMVERPGESDALISLLHESVSDLPDPQRKALLCLFAADLGSGSGNLTGRKRHAARCLGKPYNTARARRDGQPNDFDLLLISMVRSLSGGKGSGGDRGVGGPETGGALASSPVSATARSRLRLNPVAVGAGVLLTVVLVMVALFVLNGDDGSGIDSAGAVNNAPITTAIPDPAAPRPGVATPRALGEAQAGRLPDCNRPIGGPLVPATDNVWITQLMIEAYGEAVVNGFGLECPSATAQLWGAVWFQPIHGADPSQDGTIVVSRPDTASGGSGEGETHAVFLPKTIWLAYFNIGLDGGVSSQSLAGFPVDFTVDSAGRWLTRTTLGDLIITEQPNTSGRWIPHLAMPVWESRGGIDGELGLPMTNVEYIDGVVTQTYEYGRAFVGEEGVEAVVYDQAQIDADVAALPRRTNGILSSYDSTDWWIDESGVRHWIPSGPDHDGGAMWECLGGLDATIAEDLNGWVIASFPLGDNATCSIDRASSIN